MSRFQRRRRRRVELSPLAGVLLALSRLVR